MILDFCLPLRLPMVLYYCSYYDYGIHELFLQPNKKQSFELLVEIVWKQVYFKPCFRPSLPKVLKVNLRI